MPAVGDDGMPEGIDGADATIGSMLTGAGRPVGKAADGASFHNRVAI